MSYVPPRRSPDRSVKPKPEVLPSRQPSITRRAWGLAQAGSKLLYAFLAGEKIMVPNEVFEERMAICRSCPKFNAQQQKCSLCGCYAKVKLRAAQFSCPFSPPKWGIWIPPQFRD